MGFGFFLYLELTAANFGIQKDSNCQWAGKFIDTVKGLIIIIQPG